MYIKSSTVPPWLLSESAQRIRSSALDEELIVMLVAILILPISYMVSEALPPPLLVIFELIVVPTLLLVTITLVFTLAVPVTEIVTGFVPEVLQLVPDIPVCPPEDRVRFCA